MKTAKTKTIVVTGARAAARMIGNRREPARRVVAGAFAARVGAATARGWTSGCGVPDVTATVGVITTRWVTIVEPAGKMVDAGTGAEGASVGGTASLPSDRAQRRRRVVLRSAQIPTESSTTRGSTT